VEFVASLVRHDPGLVQLWWPEWLIPGYDWGVNPDHLLVIDTGEASALILVEVDESTERPPVIRERLRAYAKLFENQRTGWHLLWVANSPERLARLRQIAGPTKLPMLAGRCWGVAIDDVSDRGADAEVLAIGARLEPRPLRGMATDPKARRSEYEVGSAAWISLLANGGREDIDPLWYGVEREPAEPMTVAAPNSSESEQALLPDVTKEQPAIVDSSGAESFKTPPSPATTVRPLGLEDMRSVELAVLITGRDRDEQQAFEAASVIAARGEWSELHVAVDMLCRSDEPDDQLLGLRLIRKFQAVDPTMRQTLIALVRYLALHDDPSVAGVAQAVLEVMDRSREAGTGPA
jgi:hypothetical protein